MPGAGLLASSWKVACWDREPGSNYGKRVMDLVLVNVQMPL